MRRRPLLVSLGTLCLALAAIAAFQNFRSVNATFDEYPGLQATFWQVWFDTRGETGEVNPIFLFFVYGPFVFGALGVIFLIAHVVLKAVKAGGAVAVGAGTVGAASQWQQPQQGWQTEQGTQPQQHGWQPEQQGWQQPQQPQQAWQQTPQPEQAAPAQQPGPVQPLGGTQPPPPDADDRIQP